MVSADSQENVQPSMLHVLRIVSLECIFRNLAATMVLPVRNALRWRW